MSLFPVVVMMTSAIGKDVLQRRDLEPFHRSLQRADGVDLGDHDAGALSSERLRATLADVAVAADDCDLAPDEHIGSAVDPVDQRVAAAVLVVELRLGDRVVDVDRREQELALLGHVGQPVDAGGGLLRHALDGVGDGGPAAGIVGQAPAEQREHDGELLGLGGRGVGDVAGLLELDALVHQERGVAAVVEDHVGPALARPQQRLLGAPPVLLERLALPGEHGHSLGCVDGAVRADRHRGGGVVLGGEDVAAGPADLGAESREGLDEHGRLHGHVERAGDAGAGQWLAGGVLGPHGHEAGHLVFGQLDLLAAETGQGEVGHLEGQGSGGGRHDGSLMNWIRTCA